MERRSPTVYLLAGSLVVLVVGLVLTILPGPGLLVAAVGALGMLIGLALLMNENRGDGARPPTDRPDHGGR